MDKNHTDHADAEDSWEDKFDAGVIAADDTGMLSGERIITQSVLEEGDSDNAGGV